MKTKLSTLRNLTITLIAAICAAFGLAQFTSPAFAASGGGGGGPTLDSELIAKAFLVKAKTVRYQGGFGFTRLVDNLEVGRVEAAYQMTSDGIITQLRIDGVEVVIPKDGLKALPPNTKGQAVNYFNYVYGYDAQSENTSYARFDTSELKPGDPIQLLMEPSATRKTVPFTPPANVNLDNLRLQVGGRSWGSYYDQWRGGFTTWVNPLEDDRFDWVITDVSTGRRYASGTFNPFGPDAPVEQGSLVSFANIGGVVEVKFDPKDQWASYYVAQQQLDGQVLRGFEEGQQFVPAKVFYVNLANESGGGNLELYHNGGLAVGSSVQAFDLNADGSLTHVAALKVGSDYGYFVTPGIHSKMVITVTGALNEVSSGFSLSFYRYSGVYYPPQPVSSPASVTPKLILLNSN